jgi:hypothetical protein
MTQPFSPDPQTLEHIFNTQGHELSDEQLEALILHFRSERVRIAEAEAQGKRITKAKKPSAPSAPTSAPSLDDLLGDL